VPVQRGRRTIHDLQGRVALGVALERRGDDFRRFVFDHARAIGLPTVLVTHDETDALAAAGPVIRLSQT
jgi:ABC-type uncharacterized transport system YnjBCD ATPase subunit